MRFANHSVSSAFLLWLLVGHADSFNSRLKRPWDKPKRPNPASIRGYRNKRKSRPSAVFYMDQDRSSQYSQRFGMSSNVDEVASGQGQVDDENEEKLASSLLHSFHHINTNTSASSSNKPSLHLDTNHDELMGAPAQSLLSGESSPDVHVLKYGKEIFAMTRPENLPGVVLFHMIGSCLAFRHFESVATTVASATTYWKLLASPSMMVTLLALLLVSSTSMLVNDYYDFKLGNDSAKPGKPLQKVPMAVVKKALYYLYSISLLCSTLVPGIPGRVAVIGGLILTFLYTKHVKPRTWAKNTLCATLISLSPFTSGVAAMSVLSTKYSNLLFVDTNWPLVRLVSLLFVGILGREMAMDINDVEDDSAHGVRTVPVVYGRKFASTIAFVCSLLVTGLAVSGPLLQNAGTAVMIRRAALAGVGSLLQVRRYWNVAKLEGQDSDAIDVAVKEGLISIIVILASFV